MKRIFLFLIIVVSVSFSEIIDRNGVLSKSENQHLNSIAWSVLKNSGIKLVFVTLTSEDEISRLSSSYAIEYSLEEDGDWVIGMMTPDKEVTFTTSPEISSWFSEVFVKSFIKGTQHEAEKKGVAVAVEFFLFNAADIIAQHLDVTFNDLLSDVNSRPTKTNSMALGLVPFVLLLLVFRLVNRRKKEELTTSIPLFYLYGNSLFGITTQEHRKG